MLQKSKKITTDTGYQWDLEKLKKLARIVKKNEEEIERNEAQKAPTSALSLEPPRCQN